MCCHRIAHILTTKAITTRAALPPCAECFMFFAGIRAILNFGHTFGHVIENYLEYGTYLHGEAVAIGMHMAAVLSYKLEKIDSITLKRIKNILLSAQLPLTINNKHIENAEKRIKFDEKLNNLSVDLFISIMFGDKKTANNKLNMVLCENKLGNAVVTSDFDMQLLRETIAEFLVPAATV